MNPSVATKRIENYVSAEDTDPVAVVITGNDAWSVEKAGQLIKAARGLYKALCDLSESAAMNDNAPQMQTQIYEAQQAIAAACGATIQRERMIKP